MSTLAGESGLSVDGHHENANCAEQNNMDAFKILRRGRSITHLRILEVTFISSMNPMLCWRKGFVCLLCLFVQRRRGTQIHLTITDIDEEDSATALGASPQDSATSNWRAKH